MFAIIFNMELISIVLGLGRWPCRWCAWPAGGSRGSWAAGSFFLTALAAAFQLYILSRHARLEHTATLLDTANARFLAAMVLLVCTAALNLAAFLLARRRAHK